MLSFSREHDDVVQAMATISHEVDAIRKDKDNPHFGHKYADLDSIMAAIAPLLKDVGCVIVHSWQPIVDLNGSLIVTADGAHAAIERDVIITRMIHVESGQWVEVTCPFPADTLTNPHRVGSAFTYGRRYNTLCLLNLVPEDDDGNLAADVPSTPNRSFRGRAKQDEKGVVKAKASKDSICPICGEDIAPGMEIAWKRGQKKDSPHWGCYETWKADQEAASLDEETNK